MEGPMAARRSAGLGLDCVCILPVGLATMRWGGPRHPPWKGAGGGLFGAPGGNGAQTGGVAAPGGDGPGAAPASVNGGDGALFRIDEENRDAIGGLDAQEEAGTVRGGGIAGARFGRRGVEKMDDVGMDLFQRDELEVRCAEGGLEAAAVLEDVFCAIPFGKTEIENFIAVQEADAAGAGGEAVDAPGKFWGCPCL